MQLGVLCPCVGYNNTQRLIADHIFYLIYHLKPCYTLITLPNQCVQVQFPLVLYESCEESKEG